MMIKWNRLLAAALCVAILLVMMPTGGVVNAAEEFEISVSNASGVAGDEVTVDIVLKNNPGFSALNIALLYDTSCLTQKSIVNKATSLYMSTGSSLVWDGATNYTASGTLATVTFQIAENAPIGDHEIKLVFWGASNEDFEEVGATVSAGKITVECPHTEKTEVPEKAPFCLETGNYRYYLCSCGAVLSADGVTETTVEDQTIPALKHDWDDPTCTAPKSCKREGCGATEGASLGHQWTEKIEDAAHLKESAEKCTEFDTYWYDCVRCDAISDSEFFASTTTGAHSFTEKLEDAAHQVEGSGSNCRDAKVYYYDCAYCDLMGQDTFVSQSMGEHQVSAEWTSENDKHFHKCTIDGCTYVEDEENCAGGTATCLEKAVCSVCHKEYGKLGNHTLTHHSRNEADHTKPGNIEYWTCDLCGKYFADNGAKTEIAEKDTVIQQIPHSHSTAWSKDAVQHWNECACGDKINVFDHDYDNTCDTTCDTCGYVRTITHTWETELSYDATQHWTECSVCGEKKDVEDHHGGKADCLNKAVCIDCKQEYGSFGSHTLTHHSRNEADHTKPGNIEYWTCDLCGKYFADNGAKTEIAEKDTVIQQIPHSHSTAWSKDAAQHWNECACGDKINVFDHDYDNTCDTTCDTCGYVRTITHTWEAELSYDETQHWTECSVCGEKKDVEDHHGGKADCQNKAVCTDCGQAYGELTGCDFTAQKAQSQYLKSQATCTEAAVYYYSCTVCGKTGTDTFTHGTVDATNHVGGTELRDAAQASCTQDGYTGDTYCKGCDKKLQSGSVIPGGHDLTYVAENAATHEAAGNKAYYVCSVCDKLYAEEQAVTELTPEDVIIPKGEHEYGDEYCYDENSHWKECTCGSKIEEGTHTYGEWVVTQEAAVGVDGSKERECTDCGYKQTQKIPAPATPSTGDDTRLDLLVAMLLISLCGMLAMLFLIPQKKGKYQR